MLSVSNPVTVSADVDMTASAAVPVLLMLKLSAVPVPEATKVLPRAVKTALVAPTPKFNVLSPVLKVYTGAMALVCATAVVTVVIEDAIRARLISASVAAVPMAVVTSTA